MKRFFSFVCIILAVSCVRLSAQTIISWNPNLLSGTFGPSPYTPGFLDPAFTSPTAGLIRGSAIATGGTPAGGCYGGSGGWASGGPEANSFYFSIVAACRVVSLSSIAGATRHSSTGPTSCNVYYSLNGGPYILIGVWSTTVTSGTTGTPGSCALSSIVPLQNIPAGTTIGFKFTPNGTTGNYYFTSSSLALTGTAAAVAAPVIGTDPSTVTITATTGTSFTVSGVTDAASFQWQRNTSGIVGGTWVDITSATLDPVGTYAGYTTTSTATSNTLTLSSVPASWNGYGYRCVVTNCTGTTNSGGALLNVSAGTCSGTPAAGTATPAIPTFCGSGSTTLTLTGGSSGLGLTYQWSSSATNIPPGTNIPGATSISYTAPTISSTTYYWCTTTCSASLLSNISATGVVSINPLPSVSVTPAGGNVCASGSGLSMTASGASTYTWSPSTGLSATTGATVTANPTGNTVYTITGTSAASCVGTNTVNVTYSLNPSSLAVTPSSAAICQGTAPQLLTATGGVVGPTTANSGSVTIPASISASGTITTGVAVAGIPAGAVITGASVNVINFGSQYQDDYDINIKAPNGNILNLIFTRGTHVSTVGTLYANTVLSSTGVTSLASGSGTYTGTWAADAQSAAGGGPNISNITSWAGLYSVPNGVWTLSFFNHSAFTNVVVPTAQWSITLNYTYQAPVTWSPVTNLYTDAAGTIPYTGSAVNSVYVNPSAAAITTYSATATNITCTSQGTTTVSINPTPAALTGTMAVCQGLTTTLTETATGGTWDNGGSANASVDASGIVSGLLPGTAGITYTLPTGCKTQSTVTVNLLPNPIGGTMTVCKGLTTALTETSTGGTWSTLPGNASVDAFGTVTGNTTGTAIVTYTLPTSCIATTTVTVNPLPNPIAGTPQVCFGLTTALTETTTGGTWGSSLSTTAPVDAFGTVTGSAAGTAIITYTLPTTCIATQAVTVNPLPTAITGTLTVCKGLTTLLGESTGGGAWSSGATSIATIDATGLVTGVSPGNATITYTLPTGCIATAVLTVNDLPATITGLPGVCEGQTISLNETTPGGTWGSSATGTATVSSPVAGTAIVTGGTAGVVNITYTLPTSCIMTKAITVNPSPAAITGLLNVCQGLTTALGNSVTGGAWTSIAPSTATVSTSGVVTGVTPGITSIIYILPAGCSTSANVTVNPVPDPISGSFNVCQGLTTTLTNTTPGGTWSSSVPAHATIDVTTGLVSGILAGTSAITYTMAAGCIATTTITVNPPASPITGVTNVCVGLSTTLSDLGGGTWSSSNSNAFVGVTNGIVTGANAGTVTITYTLPTSCKTTTTVVVNPLPGPIGGPTGVCVASSVVLTNSASGGTWASSNTNASIGITSGVTTGMSPGVAIITYKLPTGCIMVKGLSISPLPAPIAGPSVFCEFTTMTLTDVSTTGSWSSSSPHAVIDAASGVVTAISGGPATISYTISAGCSATKNISVNPVPYSPAGTPVACVGATTTLLSGPTSGTWSASNSNATVGLVSGIVTGITDGTVIITYTLSSTGCTTLRIVTVAALPDAITGATAFCQGSTITLNDATTGGSWSTSNTTVTIGTASGIVTGLTQGFAVLTYSMPSGCVAYATVLVNPLPNPYTVTGGGNYCAGSPGVHIGLSGSDADVTYQLYNGTLAVASLATGSSMPVDFGLLGLAGTYTVHAVYAATGCGANMSGSAFVAITPTVTPTVSFVTSTGSDVACAGLSMKFSATPVNGGPLPVYYWSVNGTPAGVSVDTFAYTPSPGDIVKVKMISSAVCPAPDSALSSHALTVSSIVIPYATVGAVPGNIVCSGTQVTFNATPYGGGSSPVFTWKVNGVNVSSGTSYAYTPANGDLVGVSLVSNAMCTVTDSMFSGYTTMDVRAPVVPTVTVTASPGVDLATGQFVTFTATVANGTPTVFYQWSVNGIPVPGATFSSFSGSSFANNSVVSCAVTNTDICSGGGSASAKLHITNGVNELNPAIGDDLHIFPNPNNGSFTLARTLSTGGDIAIAVTDVLGQVVYEGHTSSNAAGSINEKIQLGAGLANGMYLLNVKIEGGNKVFHFVVKQ